MGTGGEHGVTVRESEVVNEGYKVDNVKGRVALDVEWNAKDGNLDRDVGAYRALYDAGLIDGAVVLTRTHDDLRELAATWPAPPVAATSRCAAACRPRPPPISASSSPGCPAETPAAARCSRSPSAAGAGAPRATRPTPDPRPANHRSCSSTG